MYYAGIHADRSYLTVAIVDESGELVQERKRVPIWDGEPLREALAGFCPLKAVVETWDDWDAQHIARDLDEQRVGRQLRKDPPMRLRYTTDRRLAQALEPSSLSSGKEG